MSQLDPLEFDSSRNEPFLRLREHRNIILTPPRPSSDAPRLVGLLSDPIIYMQLARSPVPYRLEDANALLERIQVQADAIFKALEDAKDEPAALVGCPVSFIREIQDDGSQLLIGHIDIRTSASSSRNFREIEGNRVVEKQPQAQSRDTGHQVVSRDDPIEWTIGDWLSPSHHGRGIMTDAVRTLIQDWAVPRMRVQRIVVGAFTGNPASVRVFEKNGFRTTSVVEDALEVRGEMRGLHMMEWVAPA